MIATLILLQTALPKTFAELEKMKLDSFVALESFQGTYYVTVRPYEAVEQFFEHIITVGGGSRRNKVIFNGKSLSESAATKEGGWVIVHSQKTYRMLKAGTDFDYPFQPKIAEEDSLWWEFEEFGVRFTLPGNSRLNPPVKETVQGKNLLRYDAFTKMGDVIPVSLKQWLDPQTNVVYRFELNIDNGKSAIISGILRDEKINGAIYPATFQLPDYVKRDYTLENP